MPHIEAYGRLLIKLYLLRRTENYIHMHADLILLASWLFGDAPTFEYNNTIGNRVACVVCRNCLTIQNCGLMIGGKVTYACSRCSGVWLPTRIDDYEFSVLNKLTGLDRDCLNFLFCEAVYELWHHNGNGGWLEHVRYK